MTAPLPPSASKGDIAHSAVKVIAGAVPYVGGAAAELFQLVVTPPLERRRQAWMESISDGLNNLEEKQKCVINELQANESFIDTIMQASHAAMRTSQEEKRRALRNAVLNAALPNPPDEARQHIFINWVESMTVWHLRMLQLFADPPAWYQTNRRQPPQFAISGSLSTLLTDAYPALQSQRELYDKIAKDLYNDGLLKANGLHTMMSGSGPFERRATQLGDEFIAFIADPED